jgi:hypothetical protein
MATGNCAHESREFSRMIDKPEYFFVPGQMMLAFVRHREYDRRNEAKREFPW